MDTIKVDAQKLQLLNDRITQCIDALHQVRLSAHGMQNPNGMSAFGPQGIQHSTPSYTPWSPQPFGAMQPSYGMQGIQHTAPQLGYGQPYPPQGQLGYGQPGQLGQVGPMTPWQQQVGGISHSEPRFAPTFPYAQYGYPHVVPMY